MHEHLTISRFFRWTAWRQWWLRQATRTLIRCSAFFYGFCDVKISSNGFVHDLNAQNCEIDVIVIFVWIMVIEWKASTWGGHVGLWLNYQFDFCSLLKMKLRSYAFARSKYKDCVVSYTWLTEMRIRGLGFFTSARKICVFPHNIMCPMVARKCHQAIDVASTTNAVFDCLCAFWVPWW